MIYLNNAATSYPKPQCVLDAHAAALLALPAGQFRSASSQNEGNAVESCRKKLGELFQVTRFERIYFTSGATESLNIVLRGIGLGANQILTTQTEHNSVLRPLFQMAKEQGIEKGPTIIPCEKNGRINPQEVEKAITNEIKAIVLNHCSNVTGYIQDAEKIGLIAKRFGIIFILDASQSAGCIPIEAEKWGVSALIFTGHKSLLGVQGTGGFYIAPEINLKPLKFGGTGRDSSILTYDGVKTEYEYEVGTQNIPGIRALEAGVTYILERGIPKIFEKEYTLISKIYEALQKIPSVSVYGRKGENQGPVLSFNIKGLKPSDVAYILQNGYDIITRTGLHCAPLIHQSMGTFPDGTVRVSVSDMTTEWEINQLINAIDEIACSVKS